MANFHFELTDDDAMQRVLIVPAGEPYYATIHCYACNEPIFRNVQQINVRTLIMGVLLHVCR